MLSIIHKKAYQDFLDLLKEWKIIVKDADFDPRKPENRELWQSLQTIFRDRVLQVTDAEMDLATASNWISIHAEIQREFRLLITDYLFLQSSRQTTTKQNRQTSILQHLDRLISYCQRLLAEDKN